MFFQLISFKVGLFWYKHNNWKNTTNTIKHNNIIKTWFSYTVRLRVIYSIAFLYDIYSIYSFFFRNLNDIYLFLFIFCCLDIKPLTVFVICDLYWLKRIMWTFYNLKIKLQMRLECRPQPDGAIRGQMCTPWCLCDIILIVSKATGLAVTQVIWYSLWSHKLMFTCCRRCTEMLTASSSLSLSLWHTQTCLLMQLVNVHRSLLNAGMAVLSVGCSLGWMLCTGGWCGYRSKHLRVSDHHKDIFHPFSCHIG